MGDATGSSDAGEDAADRSREETESEARAEEDAREVGSEWHVWLAAIVVVAGVVLLFAPGSFVPELLTYVGALLILAGVLGWVLRWAISQSG